MLRKLLGVAALVLVLSHCAADYPLGSSAEEFMVHDWRVKGHPKCLGSHRTEDARRALPLAIGPLPVPGQFLKVESLPFDLVPEIMGPGRESSAPWPIAEGFTGRCYVSGRDNDATALLFVWGTNDFAQCIAVFKSRELLAQSVDCAPSDKVHERLQTPEGLRLGLARAEVEALLGAPDCRAADRIGYGQYFHLPATKDLLRELGYEYAPGEDAVLRYQDAMIWFQGGRVVGFAVGQNTHYN